MYRIVVYPEAREQLAALPTVALRGYAEAAAAFEAAPWDGPPHHQANPDGEVRRWHFGPGTAGQVIYLVMERDREVHVLLVQWLGPDDA